MSPEIARAWIEVIRDALFVGIGAFMAIFATTHAAELPFAALSALIFGAFCSAGLPVAFRWKDLFGGTGT